MPKAVYARQWTEVVTTGHSLKVYSEKVPPGYVLNVSGCFFYLPESEASDPAIIYMENGGENIVLRSRILTAALMGISIFNPFPLGEGDRIFGYASLADEGDSLVLNIVGELIPVGEWRNYQG